MPAMAGTFACPHCGAQYPIKPVLVGRAVRCTTCKNPFRLREDGVADKVIEAAPEPAPTRPTVANPANPANPVMAPQSPVVPVSRPLSPPPPPPPSAPADQAAAPTRVSSSLPTARPTRTRPSERIDKEKLEEQRRAMSASLSSAASAALESEVMKREKPARPTRKTAGSPAAVEGRVGDIGPVVLTGFGAHEHRNNIIWLLGSIGVIAFVVIVIALFTMRSDQQRALDDFTANVDAARVRNGEKLLAIQERAWMNGVAPVVTQGRMHIESVRSLSLASVRDILTSLHDKIHLAQHNLWVEPAAVTQVESLWDARRDQAANLSRVRQAGVTLVEDSAITIALTTAGWSEPDAAVLHQLLTGQTSRSGDNVIAKKILGGAIPDAIELCPFHGTKGELLVDLGRAYQRVAVDYDGLLLRLVGEGWSGEWKVFSITTSAVK